MVEVKRDNILTGVVLKIPSKVCTSKMICLTALFVFRVNRYPS